MNEIILAPCDAGYVQNCILYHLVMFCLQSPMDVEGPPTLRKSTRVRALTQKFKSHASFRPPPGLVKRRRCSPHQTCLKYNFKSYNKRTLTASALSWKYKADQ
jgi:hypothetical protein